MMTAYNATKKYLRIMFVSAITMLCTIGLLKSQSSVVTPDNGLEVFTKNETEAQFLKVSNAAQNGGYDFELIAQKDLSINESGIAPRIYLKKGGNIGIGTNTPGADFHLKQGTVSTSNNVVTGSGGIYIERDGAVNQWKTYHSGSHLSFAENTNGDGNTAFRRSYIAAGTGSYVVTSDGRFKKEVESIKESILSKVLKLQPKLYNYKDARVGQKKTLGFIAQEVQRLFPEIVYETEDKTLGLSYADFGILAIKAIQELSAVDVEQRKEIKDLEQELQEVVLQKETITNQQIQINNQQQQIDELKSLVEKLLTQKIENPQGNNYELELKKIPALQQNQPNPFRENTMVNYFIPNTAQNAHIQVTSVDGKVLGIVKIQEKGQGQATIKAATYPAGTYYYSLIVDGQVFETKKMVLTK